MAKPTQKQIDQEIEKLADLQQHVRHYSIFGDDNRLQIAVQIEVLVHNLDTEEIGDRFATESMLLYETALVARDWLDGESDNDTLSEGWEGLRE